MNAMSDYQAIIKAPFGVLGIRCNAIELVGIDFMEQNTSLLEPINPFAEIICKQLQMYFIDANFHFTLPLNLHGTVHQNKVWRAMCLIPRGQTRQYGELARELNSSPRAVGQACGANPVPIVIPCHRVVSKIGLGGFANHTDGKALQIKRWLLEHEQC